MSLVWYAAYGSNLSRRRFDCYLRGGVPLGATHAFPGCRNASPPERDEPARLDLELAFGGSSVTWGGGVAFLDPDSPAPGSTLARLYLVDDEQVADVVAQENWLEPGEVAIDPTVGPGEVLVGPHTYGLLLWLPDFDGHPVVTITQHRGTVEAPPTLPYLAHLATGLAEAHGLARREIADYLRARRGVRGALTVADLATGIFWEPGRPGGLMPADRKNAAAVRRYLEALEQHKPRRGRRRTPESIKKRIADIESRATSASAVQRLALIQERLDLERELNGLEAASDLAGLEAEFVKAAAAYSEAKGISYTAWRELGVPAEVLRKAGVPRTRRRGSGA